MDDSSKSFIPLTCRVCLKDDLTAGDFTDSTIPLLGRKPVNGTFGVCRLCIARRNRNRYVKNPEIEREKSRRWYRNNATQARETARKNRVKNRRLVIEHYGGKCVCCNTTETAWLEVDHIDDDGTPDREAHGTGGAFFQWLINNGFPEGLQILCANCHLAKSSGVTCPHKIERKP